VKISFVAGFGPIVRDLDSSRHFWESSLALPIEEAAPGYWATDDVEGVKAFALWPLEQAAEACFGTSTWPENITAPQAWIELDVESPEAVSAAVNELEAAGHELLSGVREEPWGQTTSHLLSPEGLLVGVTYTPWMHSTHGGGETNQSP
jgi:hypothetical protein